MEIYVVQNGDTIYSIADKFGISADRLILDNGLINPYYLVIGQALIILTPQKTYVVKPDDSVESIVAANGITNWQLIRNNPFLSGREKLYPGETLVISYNTVKDLQVNGYTYAFISHDTLKRSLPYLTYLSIFNYRIVADGSIIDFGYVTDIIKIAKEYQTKPLLMISAFSQTGELDLDIVYNILLSEEKQERLVHDILQIVKDKGFMGINILVSNLTETNQSLYLNYITKLSKALRAEGNLLMLTISPDLKKENGTIVFDKIDYSKVGTLVDRIIFLKNTWGINNNPPAPVSNITLIRAFIEHIITIIPPDIVSIGKPLIGYDWELPFIPGKSKANAMSLTSALTLAYDERAIIQFDVESQTPYFNYTRSNVGAPEDHIVWFIDARSMKALDDVIIEYNLVGSGIWNISNYYQQMWSIINAIFNIVKFPISIQ